MFTATTKSTLDRAADPRPKNRKGFFPAIPLFFISEKNPSQKQATEPRSQANPGDPAAGSQPENRLENRSQKRGVFGASGALYVIGAKNPSQKQAAQARRLQRATGKSVAPLPPPLSEMPTRPHAAHPGAARLSLAGYRTGRLLMNQRPVHSPDCQTGRAAGQPALRLSALALPANPCSLPPPFFPSRPPPLLIPARGRQKDSRCKLRQKLYIKTVRQNHARKTDSFPRPKYYSL
jgi:hypothetical protein